jgi:exosortase
MGSATLDPVRTRGAYRLAVDFAPVLWVCLLISASYYPVLGPLFHQWHTNEDMGHGLFVPLFAAYITWERRAAVKSILSHRSNETDNGSTLGLLLIVWSSIQLTVALLAAELFLQRTALLLAITGTVLYLGGSKLFAKLAFPLALLVFSIPIPGIALKSITFPLQLLSSQLAESSLELIGHTVVREGNVLELAGQQLSVAEACNGIRAILSLSFFSACYAYLCESRRSIRLVLLAATIPVAILANAGRIVVIAVLGEIDRELATGFLHTASGWAIFVISVALLILVHRIVGFLTVKPRRSVG